MTIHGLQKMTLLDYPSKVACTIFTGGCNLRCPFCHNAPLVTSLRNDEEIPEDEVLSFLKKRAGLLDAVCISGGEPLLQPDIKEFIKKVKDFGYDIKLDTNGSLPERLLELIDGGNISYVAMDIKNSKEKYAKTAGVSENILPKIEKSINILLSSDIDFEFRTTVTAELHTVSDIKKIGEWIQGAKKYFIQPFVESDNLIGGMPLSAPSEDVLFEMEKAASAFVPAAKLRGI